MLHLFTPFRHCPIRIVIFIDSHIRSSVIVIGMLILDFEMLALRYQKALKISEKSETIMRRVTHYNVVEITSLLNISLNM